MRCVGALLLCWLLAACGARGPTPEARALLEQHEDPRTWEVLDEAEVGGWPRRVRDPRTSIEFVLVPAGEFTMGGKLPEELPRHRVRISRPFYLARTELTIAQWRRHVDEFGGDAAVEISEGPDDHPAAGMTWLAAQDYCRLYGLRLPTEAEWEYAARAGADDEAGFWSDSAALNEHSWNGTNAQGRHQPVGTRKANALGLHDMLGNVWEWCADIFAGGYDVADPEGLTVDPTGPATADGIEGRVLRGGSCFTHPPPRPSDRSAAQPTNGSPFYGMRVVRSLEE